MRSRAFPSSEARVLLSGLAFPESPRWCDGRLWVCSWGAQEIVAVDPEGGSEVVLPAPTASLPFSVDWLHDGRMVIVDGRGNAYVNGPGFHIMAGEAFAPGIIAVVTPNGAVRQVADSVAFPNGMA